MKKLSKIAICLTLGLASLFSQSLCSAEQNSLKIGVVNFKHCVEQSKIGKKEQAQFEDLKKQMENVLAEKEKALNEMATKFNDADYLDSLSPEAETELKRKFRAQNQDLAQLQNQYMQSLQQTNFKVIQKLNEMISKAADTIAKKERYDLILNEEAAFFFTSGIDLSSKVIAILDEDFEKMPKDTKEKTSSALDQLR
jgi:outer membrane protein